jgi:hypothetical protein
MHDNDDVMDYNEQERAQFAALPRELAVATGEADRLIAAMRTEGFFHRRRVARTWMWQAAAALTLFVGGGLAGYGGAHYTSRNSLESMLTRKNLTLTDRVLLLQRAGSAYVQAANGYADATTHADAVAVEVAQRVLLGAAQAVARRSMDGGMTTRLASVLSSPGASQ